jgi:hypothetical protein
VLEAFDKDDLAKNLKDLDFESSDLPMQRSLGLLWDSELDEFTFSVSTDVKPYTRRGVLFTINSLYDPFGFESPALIGDISKYYTTVCVIKEIIWVNL